MPDWTVPGDPKPELGGLDCLASIIKSEKNQGNCLVLDAGDFARGSPEANRTQGMALVDLLSRIGYDAVCVGERDIPYVMANIDAIAGQARFRLLGERCLSIHAAVDMPVTRPSLLKDVAGRKVGLIGLLDDALIQPENGDTSLLSSGLTPEQILEREIKSLRSQNAELLIVLAHMTLDRVRQLAARFPEVTAFICGHEGFIAEPRNVSSPELPLILAAGRRATRVGICRMYYDSTRHRIASVRNRIVNLLPGRAPPDTAVGRNVAQYLDPALSDSLAFSLIELLPGARGFSPLGQWVAENVARQTNGAAILPYSALDCALLKGPVSERALRRIAPYDQALVRVTLDELQVTQVLDEMLRQDERQRPAVSGISFDLVPADTSNPRFHARAVNVRLSGIGRNQGVILPRSLALSAGLPSRSYVPLKASLTDLLVAAVKANGILGVPAPDSARLRTGPPVGKVDINTATRAELQTLPGIGPAFAERIIRHRQQYGPFGKIEDIMNVKGIGPKRFEKIKDRITI